jgi:hypothetical protein
MERQSATIQVLVELPLTVHRDPLFSIVTMRESPLPHQRAGTPVASLRGNLYHDKNPAKGNISSIPLSEEKCWNSRRKSSKLQPQGNKGLKP